MVKHIIQESTQTPPLHILKCENQKNIAKFTRLMNTINKLEDRMDSFRNEMALFSRIAAILKNTPQQPKSCSDLQSDCESLFLENNKDFYNQNIQNPFSLENKMQTSNSNEEPVFQSDDELEQVKPHIISGFYGDYAKKLVMGEKIKTFVEIYSKMKEKKAEHVEFFTEKMKEIMREMSLFQELDNPRLLYLLRKVQKIKKTLISLLPEKME